MGVPQGTKLGPLLCMLCVIYLLKALKVECIISYVGETVVAAQGKTLKHRTS